MEKRSIIDSHSHIGFDYTWSIPGTLEEYVRKARKLGICESLLMPVPMPILKLGSCEVIPIMLGTYEEESFVVQGVYDSHGLRPIPLSDNPYRYVNELLYQNIFHFHDCGIDLHFVPLIHPLFDTNDYLDEVIEKYHPVAIKIHGYSSLFSPLEISPDFFRIIQQYDIPIIIHTDCDIDTDSDSLDTYLRNENSPLNWIKVLEPYSIRTYLTHGARLCEKSSTIINENPNFVVGLGPDLLLSNCQDRLYSDDEYLKTLFSRIDSNKICFDLDYPWNVCSYDQNSLDWNSLERIETLGLTEEEKEKVYSKNSKAFFHLL